MSITSSSAILAGRAHSIVMHLASGFDIAGTAVRLGLSRSEVTAEIAATCRRHGIRDATASVFVGVALRRNLVTWPPQPPDLAPEQVDILELIEAGYSTREIADDLGLSLGAAGHRVEQLLHALVAINRTHAVALGYQYGILGRSRRRPTHPDGGHSLTSQTTALVTDRARDIIEHLAKGHLREEAAHILGLSRPTVQREITKACSDLKVPNRSTAVVNSAISKGVISLPPCDPVDLSTDQIVELRLIATGYRNPEIAALLGIPIDTVSNHVGQIMKLLGAKNRVHMVALGWQRGILGRPGNPPSSSAPAAPPAE